MAERQAKSDVRHRRPMLPLLLAIVLYISAPPSASPCSSFAFPNAGFLVFGANYDNLWAPGYLFVNKRGVRKSGWEAGTTGKMTTWISRYGSVTISCAGYQLAWGGMNEAGLCFSTMALRETQVPAADERPPLAGAYWWQYMLDTCATIEDVREASKSVRLGDTVDHYLACDRTGAVALVECIGGRLVIRTGLDLPVNALANDPYQTCLDHWTSKAPAPAGAYDSRNRFSKLAKGMAEFRAGSGASAVDYAFGLLAGVSAAHTRWSFVCDTGARVFYLKSSKNPKVRFVDLKRLDFGCGRPTAVLDAHSELQGDVTGAFHDYSHEEAAAHMVAALKYFRPSISPETVLRLLALFESFPCEPAGALR